MFCYKWRIILCVSFSVDSEEELDDIDLMATQTFVTDLQAMNPTVVQVHQVNQVPFVKRI